MLRCIKCGRSCDPGPDTLQCPYCGSMVLPVNSSKVSLSDVKSVLSKARCSGVKCLSSFLVTKSDFMISLGEGLTPLIKAENLGSLMDLRNLFIKDESRNPTGVFIDRGAVTVTAAAKAFGLNKVVIASLGDLGVSVSAYARHLRLKSLVFMPYSVSPTKAYQSMLLSDKVRFVSSYEEAVKHAIKRRGGMPVTPMNPYLLDGYRTLYYEVVAELGRHPDVVVVPVGDGGLLAMVWESIYELGGRDVRIYGVKASTDSPLLKDISVANPLLKDVIDEVLSSGVGEEIIEIQEDDVINAIKTLAATEGLLTDPIGASSIAALMKLVRRGDIDSRDLVVAVMSSGGLRDVAVLRYLCSESAEVSRYGLKIGFTKSKILELLAVKGPLHPYAVWKELRQGYGIKISIRVLYQHVKELEDMGLIRMCGEVKVDGRVRKLYEVTPRGLMMIR